jgi:hypothetical protein
LSFEISGDQIALGVLKQKVNYFPHGSDSTRSMQSCPPTPIFEINICARCQTRPHAIGIATRSSFHKKHTMLSLHMDFRIVFLTNWLSNFQHL